MPPSPIRLISVKWLKFFRARMLCWQFGQATSVNGITSDMSMTVWQEGQDSNTLSGPDSTGIASSNVSADSGLG